MTWGEGIDDFGEVIDHFGEGIDGYPIQQLWKPGRSEADRRAPDPLIH